MLTFGLGLCCALSLRAADHAERVVRIGVDRNTPPMSYLDDDGVLRGFTPELLAEIEGIKGLHYELVPGFWKDLTAAFAAGEIDVLANITIREERRETMAFTIQHSYVHGVTYTRPGDPPLKHTAQFRGMRMASLRNSISDLNAQAHGGWGAEIVHYSTWQETLAAVQRGECDFALIVRPLSFEQPDELGLRCNFVDDIRHSFHMAVHKGDLRLLEDLNEALATARHNGTTDSLFAQWIGPIGPRPIHPVDLRPYAWPALAVLIGLALIFLWQQHINLKLSRQAKALQVSEDKYRRLVDHTNEGIFVVQDHRFCYVNPAILQMTGLTAEAMLGRSIFDFIPPAEHAVAEAWQQDLLTGHRNANQQDYHIVLASGRELRLAISSVPIEWQGRPATLSFASDVTAVRQAEQAREEAAKRLEKIANRVPGVVYQYRLRPDGTSCFPYASEGIRTIYGVAPEAVREDASPVFTVIHPEDVDRVATSIQESAQTLGPWAAEFRVCLPDGSVRWARGNSVPEKETDGSILWHGSIVDVTEPKRAELALEHERRRLADIIEGTNAGTWEWYVSTGKTVFNERWALMLGYRLEELQPTTLKVWEQLAQPDDLARAGELLQRHMKGESEYYECEIRLRHKQGHWVWVLTRGKVITRAADGSPLLMSGTHLDITARKQAEIDLVILEERFRKSVVHSPVPTMIHASDGSVLHVSESWCLGTGYTREELSTIEDWTRLAYGERAADVRRVIARLYDPTAKPEEGDYVITNKSGESRIWDFKSAHLGQLSDGRSLVISMAVDVTERRRTEEAVRQALRDKEALLKEVHHRVKNNLQVITSLLRLETSRHQNTAARVVLQEMQDRIRSMALLHEAVYRAENIARVNLALYLREVSQQLFRFHTDTHGRVGLKLELDEVMVELDQAIPCGLIVNELVTNSLKHGFPNRQQGQVRVAVKMRSDGQAQLVVSDNGVGLPAGFDPTKTDTLGLCLVVDLARQLGGQLEIEAGPAFAVVFQPKLWVRDSQQPFVPRS